MRRKKAGLAVKLNMVVIKGFNDKEVVSVMQWAHGRGMDLTLIEVMPFGDGERWLPNLVGLDELRAKLEQKFTLSDLPLKTGGPARYVKVEETGGKLGFITPPCPVIFATAATASASPAEAASINALAVKPMSIYAQFCKAMRGMRLSSPPSARPSPPNPKATILKNADPAAHQTPNAACRQQGGEGEKKKHQITPLFLE